MNERRYYNDSYTTTFSTAVTDHLVHDGNPAVILDQTYFYPTSGGQPHDLGTLNGVPVIDVLVRTTDGAIVHLLENEIENKQVSAVIDWSRRFDHMQQHTGQHILSQAFIRIAGAETIGFHLSGSSVTIDLDKEILSEAEIDAAEQMANDIIWQNIPVKVIEVPAEDALALPLRKIPPTTNGPIRLIDITGFDLTACGGTHVAHTAEVGLLKIVKQERRGQKQRIEFCCGNRALTDYRLKNKVTSQLSSLLTTGTTELVSAVSRLQDDVQQARRRLKKQEELLRSLEAQQLLEHGRRHGSLTLVTQVFTDRDQGDIRTLGKILVQNENTVALLGLAGERSQLIFSKAEGVPGSMKEILPAGLEELGSQSGGGNDTFAQGVGPPADLNQVQQAITSAKTLFLRKIGLMR
jgi:alanyl-tRNA synthetase